MFSEFLDGDLSGGGLGDFGDSGLADIFGSLQDLMRGMGGMVPPDTSAASPAGAPGGDASAEAAGQLFASLFEGDSSPFAAFMNSAGDASSVLTSFLGGSAGGSGSGASQRSGFASLFGNGGSGLGSLFGGSFLSGFGGGSTASGGSSSSSSAASSRSAAPGPFADLLQPVGEAAASTRAMVGQLAAAIKQADALLQAPDVNDLFGGGAQGLGWRACTPL
jgi:hypothetical protein